MGNRGARIIPPRIGSPLAHRDGESDLDRGSSGALIIAGVGHGGEVGQWGAQWFKPCALLFRSHNHLCLFYFVFVPHLLYIHFHCIFSPSLPSCLCLRPISFLLSFRIASMRKGRQGKTKRGGSERVVQEARGSQAKRSDWEIKRREGEKNGGEEKAM